jgi:response regulator NasT
LGGWPAQLGDALDQQQPAELGQAGMSMGHEGPSRLGASTTQADRGDPQLSTTLTGTTPTRELHLAATLLSQAVGAQVKGRLAEQLQTPFAHRTRIERAKGMLMLQEGIDDAAAFERLRSAARSAQRPLIEVVDEVLGGQRLSRPRR